MQLHTAKVQELEQTLVYLQRNKSVGKITVETLRGALAVFENTVNVLGAALVRMELRGDFEIKTYDSYNNKAGRGTRSERTTPYSEVVWENKQFRVTRLERGNRYAWSGLTFSAWIDQEKGIFLKGLAPKFLLDTVGIVQIENDKVLLRFRCEFPASD